jgi:hypothetical protein
MPAAAGPHRYWSLTRSARYSLLFALPLLLLYELLAFVLSGDSIAGVRNGADVLLKSIFLALGGPHIRPAEEASRKERLLGASRWSSL